MSAIGEMAKAGAGYIADLIARIMGGIQGAVLALAPVLGGCEAQESAASKPAPQAEVVVPAPEPVVDEGPKQLGLFTITFYYVVGEDEVAAKAKQKAAANDNQPTDDSE